MFQKVHSQIFSPIGRLEAENNNIAFAAFAMFLQVVDTLCALLHTNLLLCAMAKLKCRRPWATHVQVAFDLLLPHKATIYKGRRFQWTFFQQLSISTMISISAV